MSEASIKLHIETLTDDSYVPSFTAKISVTEAVGVTQCIFVHMYMPRSAGKQGSYDFLSVAYADELNSVPEYIKAKKSAGLVRMSEVTKGLPTKDELDDFIATVEHDVQRLLVQINTTRYSGKCIDAEITADNIIRTVSTDCENSPAEVVEDTGSDILAPGVVTLNFDGTISTEN